MNKIRTNLFIPHVYIDSIQSGVNFDFLCVEFLNNSPNNIDRIPVNNTWQKLNNYVKSYFVYIFRCYISIANCYHCSCCPVQRIYVLNKETAISERYPRFTGSNDPVWTAPACLLSGVIYDLVFEEVVGKVESAASHHIADQQNLHNQQEQLEHRLDPPVQVKRANNDILNVQEFFDPEEEYKQNKFEVLLFNLKDLYKLVEEDDCNRYYIKDKPTLYVVLSDQNRTTL